MNEVSCKNCPYERRCPPALRMECYEAHLLEDAPDDERTLNEYIAEDRRWFDRDWETYIDRDSQEDLPKIEDLLWGGGDLDR